MTKEKKQFSKMKKDKGKVLLMKFTSRNRFDQLKQCVKHYYDFADDVKSMIWAFSLDSDDNSFDEQNFVSFMDALNVSYKYFVGVSKNKIDAINRDVAMIEGWDVLLNISDDQMPVVKGYDTFIRNAMDKDNTLSLWFNDGHQDRINTQEIVGYNYYKKFDYIYHPSYKSYFCDNEATDVGLISGGIKKFSESIIRHYHPDWEVNSFIKNDELYQRYQGFWKEDEENYLARKAQNFPSKNFTKQPKLTICIPSVQERHHIFTELFNHISKQIIDPLEVEILCDIDNKEVSIGAKRQRMLQKALGKYITMVDDDDFVADDYVEKILKAIESNPDFIGFEIECSGIAGKTESVSNSWNDWGEKVGGFDYVRTPYHKSPIKTEIARQIGFKDMRYAEDYDFSKRLKQSSLIQNEVFIQKIMYFYRFKDEPHNKKYGITGQDATPNNSQEFPYRPAWR
jgi:hypothetical protein